MGFQPNYNKREKKNPLMKPLIERKIECTLGLVFKVGLWFRLKPAPYPPRLTIVPYFNFI